MDSPLSTTHDSDQYRKRRNHNGDKDHGEDDLSGYILPMFGIADAVRAWGGQFVHLFILAQQKRATHLHFKIALLSQKVRGTCAFTGSLHPSLPQQPFGQYR